MPNPERTFEKELAPEILELISGRELLIQHLGHWPTFHDFEVISLTLERAVVSAATRDLRATFFVFDLGKSPDDPERKQGTAEFLFENIDQVRIDGFNHQNPIMGLSIVSAELLGEARRFRVQWGGACIQHDVSFTCGRIAVVRVVDLNPFRKAFPIL
jgi:Immunity protein 50